MLKLKGLLKAIFEKQCFIKAFANERLVFLKNEMESYEICWIMKQPEITVMTILEMIFHWTIPTGFSLADSVNLFNNFFRNYELRGIANLMEFV